MFIIIETHYDGGILGIMMKENGSGEHITFDTDKEAELYAKENCAFKYTVTKI